MNRDDMVFPFSAIVGQEQVKLALLLNAISPEVGGVLIRGRRGTAKSSLARGLAHLLPEIDIVPDCPFSCDPRDIESLCGYCGGRLAVEGSLPSVRSRMKMVTLPLNATEEMVVGTLDIEKALKHGEKTFEPGILARANRSILYVDEVNLLEDHIVDILLDSAAMGVNVVEREGISFRHGARFILVGTMNPEEGDLRPQLEDRFGLCAEVDTETTVEARSEILRRNLQFSRSPLEFESRWHGEQEELRRKLIRAREIYRAIETPEPLIDMVARIVHEAGADGHRADLAMLHSSRALAALEDGATVEPRHMAMVAGLALNHRMRKGPLGMERGGAVDVERLVSEAGDRPDGAGSRAEERLTDGETVMEVAPGGSDTRPECEQPAVETEQEEPRLPDREMTGSTPGRRGQPAARDSRGRYYRSAPPPKGKSRITASDVALDATIRATAARGANADGKPEVRSDDIKVKLRKRKVGASIVFVVDASASMGARKRLDASRDAILSLLTEAYQRRDRVGMVVFKDDAAHLVMSPTSSPALANRLLVGLEPGGTTPLSHGLTLGFQVLDRELSRNPQPDPFLVLISDGGGNVTLGSAHPMAEAIEIAHEIGNRGIRAVVIDSAPMRADGVGMTGRPTAAKRISDAMGGLYCPVRTITRDAILDRVSESTSLSAIS